MNEGVKIEVCDNGGWYQAPNLAQWVQDDCEDCDDGVVQEVLRYQYGDNDFPAQVCRKHLVNDTVVRLA